MKLIMFSNKYGLTQAVLDERKTHTRRIATEKELRQILGLPKNADRTIEEMAEAIATKTGELEVRLFASYKIGEEVAVAQSYADICYSASVQARIEHELGISAEDSPGWRNKMFVRANLMPNHIRMTDVRFERLQDISDVDCIKEGVRKEKFGDSIRYYCKGIQEKFFSARDAYSVLIDRISGRGTWDKNPWTFVYEYYLKK